MTAPSDAEIEAAAYSVFGLEWDTKDNRKIIKRALEAAAAVRSAQADGWQPIETAPKNGTRILALQTKTHYHSLGQVRIVRHRETHWVGDVAGHYFQDIDFAGWMPLPAPPSSRS